MDKNDATWAAVITGCGGVAAFAYGQLFAMICCVTTLASIAAIVTFQIVCRYWQVRFRRMGRDLARCKGYGPHWFLGLASGLAIMTGTMYASYYWAISSISIDDIIYMRGGFVPVFGILLFATFGLATGWALMTVHMRVANHLDRKAGRRPTFTV